MKAAEQLRVGVTKLLVVEGTHEVYAFRGYFDPAVVQVISCDGKDKLAQFLTRFSKSAGFDRQIERVVVILDNDLDPAATHALALKAFATIPKPHCEFVAVPAVAQVGMFEDLLLPDNVSDAENACLDQFFACMASAASSTKPPNGKARMQSWLATKKPGKMLGSAINEGIVNRDGAEFVALIARLHAALAR
jgi:hypothetical protein